MMSISADMTSRRVKMDITETYGYCPGFRLPRFSSVFPAKAGIQGRFSYKMIRGCCRGCFRDMAGRVRERWIPACAGMTE